MKLFNSTDIAHLLQIKPAEAKAKYFTDNGEISDKELAQYLPADSPSVEELLERRSKVFQSRDQALKLTRNTSGIEKLTFPKSLRLYESVLSPASKARLMIAWQKHHLADYSRLSLTEAAESAGVTVLI